MRTKTINPLIIREYDIRGVMEQTLFEQDAYWVGRAFAICLRQSYGQQVTICVGRDGRLSSPSLEQMLISGLVDFGMEVIAIGIGPTPMLNYACGKLSCTAGVMITGSHNPADQNGFKFTVMGKPFYGQDLQNLRLIIAQEHNPPPHKGKLSTANINEHYVAQLAQSLPVSTFSLKIAWDPGNGATGEVLHALLERIGGQHIVINGAIDGNFPNHHPDPLLADNLKQLITVVKEEGCDLGIAFDGDGDRIGVVDGLGNIVTSDKLITLFAKDILAHHPGCKIIADVKTSQMVFDQIDKYGGKAIMWKTGHSLMRAKMQETGALLAGELSGHLFFADEAMEGGVYDDAIYAAVRLIRLLLKPEGSLCDRVLSLPVYYNTKELQIPCADETKFITIREIQTRLKLAGIDFNALDGIRYSNTQGFWLLRASNTGPHLIARVEGVSEAALEAMKLLLIKQLQASKLQVPNFY